MIKRIILGCSQALVIYMQETINLLTFVIFIWYIIVFVSTQGKGSKEQRERDSVKSLCENEGKCFGAEMNYMINY